MIFNKELLLYINTENIKFNRLMVVFVDLLFDECDITDMLCLIERLEESSTLARKFNQLFPCSLVHVDKYVDEFHWLGLLCKI